MSFEFLVLSFELRKRDKNSKLKTQNLDYLMIF